MDVIFLQMICLAVLFTSMTVCSILPVLFAWKRNNIHSNERVVTWISFGNCIAGGVFLGMCFLGLFPYVHGKFAEVLSHANISTSFPLSEFVIIVGFFFIFTIENVIIMARNNTEMDSISNDSLADVPKHLHDESYIRLLETESQDQDVCEDSAVSYDILGTNGNRAAHRTHCDMSFVAVNRSTGLRHLILLLAVSIHSLFEGMMLGLQTDEVKIFHLFLAVLFHEVLVALALGMNIAKLNVGLLNSLKYILIMTGSIPVGILLGLLITAAPGLFGLTVSALLQGIAAGIFIHVIYMEIIPEELANDKCRLSKIALFFIGFMLMAALNFALGDH